MSPVPERKDAPIPDTWDLSSLYADDEAWQSGLAELEGMIPEVTKFQNTLGKSAECLARALEFIVRTLGELEERLGYYVMLRHSEDIGNGTVQGLHAQYVSVTTRIEAATSWMKPEIMTISDDVMDDFLKNDLLADFRIFLFRILRLKPHVLSEKEETLLAKQTEFAQTASNAFSSLTNADMEFGTVKTSDEEEVTITHSTYASLMLNTDRSLREDAYRKFYRVFDGHKNTLANLYAGSVHLDKYIAEIRGYSSSREQALYRDNVPVVLYDNLVSTVRDNLPTLHEYYELRAERSGVSGDLRHWDTAVSLVDGGVKVNHSWNEAVEVITAALKPLGTQYVDTLRSGLSGRWADRYENKGKRSGAFSAGSYTGDPYILMNFKEDVLRDVFTLAHEGGHSMHSWYSVRNNPFPHYNYTIFEAEVASTFNEQLLAHAMLNDTSDNELKAFLIGKQIDDVVATIYRQTMFAEFERDTHAMAESGKPLTADTLRSLYRNLQEDYFGPAMNLEEVSDLECLRIPHFYSAFYVYKYATGLSAAMSLAQRVLNGGESERNDYLNFLKSGGSQFPLDSLKLAGVDMTGPDAVNTALGQFKKMIDRFKNL